MDDAGQNRYITSMSMPAITINGKPLAVTGEALASYLTGMGITAATGGVAVAVNNTVMPCAKWADYRPSDGDAIEIITAMSGG
jgi:sulfur carrier protein